MKMSKASRGNRTHRGLRRVLALLLIELFLQFLPRLALPHLPLELEELLGDVLEEVLVACGHADDGAVSAYRCAFTLGKVEWKYTSG